MLEAIELECERGGKRLFRGLSLAVRGGELIRVAGENGSGKTSLLRILCGLLSPSAGEVRWSGAGIRGLREEYAKQIVYLGHAPAVKDDLTPAENLDIACRLAGMPVAAKDLRDALDRFGLSGNEVPARRLSQGQRRRAALARLALSESAPLWLLDEPFAALDAGAARLTEDLISRHLGRGAAVVYTTHQEVSLSASRVIELGRAD